MDFCRGIKIIRKLWKLSLSKHDTDFDLLANGDFNYHNSVITTHLHGCKNVLSMCPRLLNERNLMVVQQGLKMK